MIIDDGYFAGIVTFPTENDPVLVIDADAVKALPVVLQGLQAVSWWGAQVDKSMRPGQHIQLAQGNRDDAGWISSHPRGRATMIQVFGAGVAK
jgi:hypothetical protein